MVEKSVNIPYDDTVSYKCDICGTVEDGNKPNTILVTGRDERCVDWQICKTCLNMIQDLKKVEVVDD